MLMTLYLLILSTPAIGALLIQLLKKSSLKVIRQTAIISASLPILLVGLLFYLFIRGEVNLTFSVLWEQLAFRFNLQHSEGSFVLFSANAVSIWLLVILTITSFIAILSGLYIKKRHSLYYTLVLLSQSLVYAIVVIQQPYLIVSTFALVAIIVMFSIGIWGSEGSIVAAKKFVIWQLAGCMLLMSSLFIVMHVIGESTLVSQHSWYEMFTAHHQFQDYLLEEQPEQLKLRFFAFILFLAGIGCILPIFGLHNWFIQLFKKSHPVVIVMYSSCVSIMGWYLLYKIGSYYFFDLFTSYHTIFIWIFGIQFVISSLLLWKQQQLQSWLAYGAWGQLSLIGILFSVQTEQSYTIVIMHMFSYMLLITALTISFAALYERTGKTEFRDLAGSLKTLPFLTVSIVISVLGWIGLPALSHFLGNYHLLLLTFPNERVLTVLLALSLIGNSICAVKMLYTLQRGQSKLRLEVMHDLRFMEAISSILALSFVILLGCYPVVMVDMIESDVHNLFGMWKYMSSISYLDAGSMMHVIGVAPDGMALSVFCIAMMLGIGIVSYKQSNLKIFLFWQITFQIISVIAIIGLVEWDLEGIRSLIISFGIIAILSFITVIGMLFLRKHDEVQEMNDLNGYYYRYPFRSLVIFVVMMQWIITPYVPAFLSKWFVISQWLNQGQYTLLLIWLIVQLFMVKGWLNIISAVAMKTKESEANIRTNNQNLSSRFVGIVLMIGFIMIYILSLL